MPVSDPFGSTAALRPLLVWLLVSPAVTRLSGTTEPTSRPEERIRSVTAMDSPPTVIIVRAAATRQSTHRLTPGPAAPDTRTGAGGFGNADTIRPVSTAGPVANADLTSRS